MCGLLFETQAKVEEHESLIHNNMPSPCHSYPGTPYSQATTELSSSVSSLNNSDCDPSTLYSESGTPFSSHSMSLEYEFSGSFQHNGPILDSNALEPMDFPLGGDYRNCNVCGECFLGAYELDQHLQIFHSVPSHNQLTPSIGSTDVTGSSGTPNSIPSIDQSDGCFYPDVPVPDVENVVEIETTEEFLTFLNAF